MTFSIPTLSSLTAFRQSTCPLDFSSEKVPQHVSEHAAVLRASIQDLCVVEGQGRETESRGSAVRRETTHRGGIPLGFPLFKGEKGVGG